jgi:hypothetical protein
MRLRVPEELVEGAIVAVADLGGVVTEERAKRFGRWFFGPYGFVLDNVQPLHRPVPARGKLGLWRADKRLVNKVEGALRRR